MNVKIYTTPTCGYCHMANRFLSEQGVAYREHDVSVDRQAAGEMMRLTGQMGVPVLVINGQVVVGFDRSRIQQLLSRGSGRGVCLGIKIADAVAAGRPAGATSAGAVVGDVGRGSAGAQAGIMPGDIITGANSTQVNGADDLSDFLRRFSGGSLELRIRRGGRDYRINVAI